MTENSFMKRSRKGSGKNPLMKLTAALGAALGTAFFMTAPYRASDEQKAPFIRRFYAHRGLYEKDQSIPENSLKAFGLAADAGYGIELDVQLSKDGQVVVFHDDDMKRMCKVDGPICSRTWEELKEIHLAESEEGIPLFAEVLELIGGRIPLIIELKSCKRNRELCEKTAAVLEKYQGPCCVESFDPSIVMWFRFHVGEEIMRGQLAMNAKHYELPKPLAFMLSRCLFNFLTRPHFIAYRIEDLPFTVKAACGMGALHVAWTSHEEEDAAGSDMVIFEYYRPRPFM